MDDVFRATAPDAVADHPDDGFYSAAALDGKPIPERQWLVHGLVPQNTVTLFSGDGGTGKSLLALQLSVAVAARMPWLGRPVQHGKAIVLSAEDDDNELHRRLDDILRASNRRYDDVANLKMRSLAGQDALLAFEDGIALTETALFNVLDARAAEDDPALIVIDTLADVYPANENDRAKVRQFVGLLRGLALRHQCVVLLLSHPSLTGLQSGTGTSGSTAWNNSVRSRLYLERIKEDGVEADPDTRLLTTKKANYGRTGEEFRLKWQNGVFVAEGTASGLDRLAVETRAERVFLTCLDRFTAQRRMVSASPSSTYAPTVFARNPSAEGLSKRELSAAMERLFAKNAIVVLNHGPASKPRSHIVRSPT